jgi:hypothetical protein
MWLRNLVLSVMQRLAAPLACIIVRSHICLSAHEAVGACVQMYANLQVMSQNFPVPDQATGSYLTGFSDAGFQ